MDHNPYEQAKSDLNLLESRVEIAHSDFAKALALLLRAATKEHLNRAFELDPTLKDKLKEYLKNDGKT